MFTDTVLIELATPLLLKLNINKELPQGIVSHSYHNEISDLYSKFIDAALYTRLPTSWLEEAKFALASLADEIIMHQSIVKETNWGGSTLQLKYFGEHIGGEEFFKRLHSILKEGIEKLAVLKLYYVCLLLGFKGQYHGKHNLQLQNTIFNIKQQIDNLCTFEEKQLTPDALPLLLQNKSNKPMSINFIVLGVSMFMILLYFTMLYALHKKTVPWNYFG